MRVVSTEDTETRRGPAEWFTDNVWIEAAPAESSPDARVFRVLFQPRARTNWRTHPEGQVLYIITGIGRIQREGEPVVEIRAGDVIYFAPNEKHWHGARPEAFMVHMAGNPAAPSDGGTDWIDPVTDEE